MKNQTLKKLLDANPEAKKQQHLIEVALESVKMVRSMGIESAQYRLAAPGERATARISRFSLAR